MKPRNLIAVILVLISLGLLIPGLSKDLITITASFSMFGNTTELFRKTRSILQSISDLHESGNDFVAGLVLLFSVLVPFFKIALLGVAAWVKNPRVRYRTFAFVRAISKWAMADVFVVGVYIAFLTAEATDGLDAELHSGFFWFTGYCLVSLAALQFMVFEKPQTDDKTLHQRPGAAQGGEIRDIRSPEPLAD